MKSYLDICEKVLHEGVRKENRTGIDTFGIVGHMFQHDMSEGFPLLTTKKVAYKNVLSELEFFIGGKTDKRWLQERDNPIWNAWCNPEKVAYGRDYETRRDMFLEDDLGPIYGWQWRHFGAEYNGCNEDYFGKGIDQLDFAINEIKENPTNRRLIVNSWNVSDLNKMALPPCHYSFQITTSGNRLNLGWNQRSVDVPLGLPFNIASYGTLLHLIAKETGFEEGILTGHLEDVHIYENQVEGICEQILREPKTLPSIETKNFKSIFDWSCEDTSLCDYNPSPSIKFPLAI